ncbi:MAG: hypothetical protein GY754_19560 [bacterium]|nr:hypothetical protein [bacterium]
MKIQAPLNSSMDVTDIETMDCDEFYAGFYEDSTHPESLNHISRRPGSHANFTKFSHIKKIIDTIKKNNKKIFITYNEHHYESGIADKIFADIKKLISIGIDGIIVSDINMIIRLKKQFPDLYLIASTGLHVTNSNSARFFYNLGINRIIFPRHLSIHSIDTIIDTINTKPGIDFEIFIKNDNCINVDGLCSYVHGTAGKYPFNQMCKSFCDLPANIEYEDFACGVCSLYSLRNESALSLKIVGRDRESSLIKKDIIFIKTCLALLTRAASEEKYRNDVMKKFSEIYTHACQKKCYYEVRG